MVTQHLKQIRKVKKLDEWVPHELQIKKIVILKFNLLFLLSFPRGSDGKESACNAGGMQSIPGSGRSLEEGLATHPSVLAWRSPWTEEPGGLQSMGSQSQTD